MASASSARWQACSTRARPPLLDQPQQPVDLAHLGPRQRGVQQGGGVDADGLAVIGGHAPQPVDVTRGVDLGAGGQVGRVGAALPGSLAGMDFHQLAAEVQLHRRRVPPGLDPLADEAVRGGVDRLVDLDVEVAVNLRLGPFRDVERRARQAQQAGQLLGPERLDRTALGGAVHTHARRLGAPPLRPGPTVGQAGEGLAGEEVVAHIGHRPLHPRLVRRGRHPGRVDRETPRLGVLEEHVIEPGGGVLRLHHDRAHVVRNHDREHPAEVQPRRLEPGDHILGRLGERRPHELMAAETRGEDQRPAHPLAVAVSDQAQPAEVNLQLDARRRVVHPHRRRPPARPATLHREPGQRPVRHHHTSPGQQDADLHDRELFDHPRLDPLLLGQQHPPRLAVTVRAGAGAPAPPPGRSAPR